MGYKVLKKVGTWRLDRGLNSIFPLVAHQSDCNGFRAPMDEVAGLLRCVYADCMSLMP